MKKTYYYININDDNKTIIIDLIEKQKDDIEIKNDKRNYCDSMYRIEYLQGLPDGQSFTIYCENEDNITFGIDIAGVNYISKYIKENGLIEKR